MKTKRKRLADRIIEYPVNNRGDGKLYRVDVLNRYLTGWLVEYNFNRPHQSLGYATPIEFLTEKLDEKVLPMCPIRALDIQGKSFLETPSEYLYSVHPKSGLIIFLFLSFEIFKNLIVRFWRTTCIVGIFQSRCRKDYSPLTGPLVTFPGYHQVNHIYKINLRKNYAGEGGQNEKKDF